MVKPVLQSDNAIMGLERIDAAHRRITRSLAEGGIAMPEREARRLLAAALGLSAGELIVRPETRLGPAQSERIDEMLRRRLAHEPLSRIVGEREFYGRPFKLSPETLDPRPDSETLIEAALQVIDESGWRERPLRILDVGTGSGCLLVTLLAELPCARGVGTDVSAMALQTAAENARTNGVGARARFARHRSFEGLDETFDVIVSNPPYISSGEIADLEPEVRNFDPVEALDGGPDGLNIYRELASGLVRVVPHGWALFEVGAGQAQTVAELLVRCLGGHCAGDVRLWQDLGGHTRCVALGTRS